MTNKLTRMYWYNPMERLWKPVKPKYGNYFLRGERGRSKRIFKNKVA